MAAGFQTWGVMDVLKKHSPSHFSTFSLGLAISASDLQLSAAVTALSWIIHASREAACRLGGEQDPSA